MRAGDTEKGLLGTSQNSFGILVRHQDQEGTVEEGTREKEASFLKLTELQALLPERILSLF